MKPMLGLPMLLLLIASATATAFVGQSMAFPPTDASTSAAWATWALVLVTVLVLITTLAAVWWQISAQRRIESAKMVLSLRDRYESPAMRRQRKELSQILLANGDVTHRDDDVLVLFDTVGLLTHRRILNKEMVWYEFCWDVVRYHAALVGPVNQIQKLRDTAKDKTLYAEFEWLSQSLLHFDAKKRGLRRCHETSEPNHLRERTG